jgi:hypothetical protein
LSSYLLDITLVTVTILAAAFGGASIARAADTVCTGSLSGNVAGNIYVGSGVSCTISQANIGGNVQLKSGAALFIDGRQYPSVIGASWPEVASNFHGGGNLDANPVAACKMLRTGYKLENRGPLDGAGTGLDSVACAGLD